VDKVEPQEIMEEAEERVDLELLTDHLVVAVEQNQK
jgi:hypothetical protein